MTAVSSRRPLFVSPCCSLRLSLFVSPWVMFLSSPWFLTSPNNESKHPQCLVRIVAQEVCGPTPPTRCMHHWPVHAFIVGEGRRWQWASRERVPQHGRLLGAASWVLEHSPARLLRPPRGHQTRAQVSEHSKVLGVALGASDIPRSPHLQKIQNYMGVCPPPPWKSCLHVRLLQV
jgi:hypothetical protein